MPLTPEQQEILSYLSLVDLDDGTGSLVRTLRITGVNIQIVNGMGKTATTNGSGNVIVGYQEPPVGISANLGTGSHNIVVGARHRYSSYGGLVAGERNWVSGAFATVTGGYLNEAEQSHASVSGGSRNLARARYSSVSGGRNNWSVGEYASVTGGGGDRSHHGNRAYGAYSSICGGRSNRTDARQSSITAGINNRTGDSTN